ncbi:MAG: DUF2927 domain-containing protein [Oscillospiraceae bacterium]|nr:DUF2927 domain-containing protein [Oscillospiraceae bacterium]
MKKSISTFLIVCLLVSCLSFGAAAAGDVSFTDVKEGQWFYDPIMTAADAGLVAGNPDGGYAPHRELSWVETVVFAVRLDQYMNGQPIYGSEDQVGVWYSIYTDYAKSHYFITKLDENPSRPISRGEAAEIFARVLMAQPPEPVLNDLDNNHFFDVPVGHEYHASVIVLAKAGIVNGVSDGVFGVDSTFKRSEVATIVARMAGLVEKATISKPEHSPLYIEGLSVDEVIVYFAEVCLDTEFGDKAANQYVRKWVQPIYYQVHGAPTAEDLITLEKFVETINGIPGFPGMYSADDWKVNLNIYFYGERDFINIMGSDFSTSWGGVSFWYDNYRIYSERIAVRTDIPQSNRYSIIPEEIYNGLGPVQDTSTRFDSIIYQWSDLNTVMSPEDELILKLLYNSAMIPGMDYESCAETIRELYY